MKLNTIFVYFCYMPLGYFGCDVAGRVATSRSSHSLLACAITLEEIPGISGENPFVTMLSTWAALTTAVTRPAVRINVSLGSCRILQSPMAAATAAMTMDSMAALCCIGAALSQWHFISVGLSAKDMMLCQNIVYRYTVACIYIFL